MPHRMNAPASTGAAPLDMRARPRQKITPVQMVTPDSSSVVETPATDQTGFFMKEATHGELIDACRRAIDAMKDPKAWRAIQLHGMARDFGWEPAARKYREIYNQIRATSSAPSRSGG